MQEYFFIALGGIIVSLLWYVNLRWFNDSDIDKIRYQCERCGEIRKGETHMPNLPRFGCEHSSGSHLWSTYTDKGDYQEN